MRTITKVLMPVFAAILLVACNPQESAMNDLRSFTNRLETHYQGYSDADWDDALMHYSEICATLDRYRNDYTPEQHEEIGRLKGHCVKIFATHAFEDGVNGLMQGLFQFNGMLNGLMEGLEDKQSEDTK